jgi:RNA polymerase sigma-70 factor (ECF subfamily)
MNSLDNASEFAATSTSRSLLARVNANDPNAWGRLLTLYGPLVWHWCRKLGLPEQEIADVFQEVCKSLAAHIHQFHKNAAGDSFRGWLRTITRNKVFDHFRARQREPQAAGGSGAQWQWSQIPAVEWDDAADARETTSILLQRALELIQREFADNTWRAFSRVVVDGMPPRDVAAELGMSAGAVRVAKCRVLQRLRQVLAEIWEPAKAV